MEDYIEEDEIKIEYYDSLETDPLSEKFEENTLKSSRIPDGIVSSVAIQCEGFPKNDVTHYDNTDHASLPDITIPDAEREDIDSYMNLESTSQINWYREIDESGKFVCRFCELTYSTTQTIRHHVKTKHPEQANTLKNVIKKNKRSPKIKCHICKKRYKDIESLKAHINKHHSEDFTRSCQVCFAAFNNEQEMAEHIYQEHQKTSIRTYSCSLCGYRTRKLSHFKQHRNTHLRNKQIKCDSCDYATNYLPNLKIHQRIHTNYKPYLCTVSHCGYRCSAKSALRSHQLKHNPEENMLYCDKCTYKTVYKSSLKKHNDSHKRNSLKLV